VIKRPPDVPSHAGTGHIDVVDLSILADTEADRTPEDNRKKIASAIQIPTRLFA